MEDSGMAREYLKVNIPERDIATLIDTLEEGKNSIINMYKKIRAHLTPSTETRRRIDACEAVTRDIVKILKGYQEFMKNLIVK